MNNLGCISVLVLSFLKTLLYDSGVEILFYLIEIPVIIISTFLIHQIIELQLNPLKCQLPCPNLAQFINTVSTSI